LDSGSEIGDAKAIEAQVTRTAKICESCILGGKFGLQRQIATLVRNEISSGHPHLLQLPRPVSRALGHVIGENGVEAPNSYNKFRLDSLLG
jgi:hypothetical protein